MKKHLIMSVLALVITASAFGDNVVDKGGGGVPAAGGAGGGGGAALGNSTEGMAKFGDAVGFIHDLGERAQKEAKAAHDREQKQSEHADGREKVEPDLKEHQNGHERSATGKGDERPVKSAPAPSPAGRAGDARDAHDSHEVHVHEPEVHEHEPAARDHEPVVHEGNAGRRS